MNYGTYLLMVFSLVVVACNLSDDDTGELKYQDDEVNVRAIGGTNIQWDSKEIPVCFITLAAKFATFQADQRKIVKDSITEQYGRAGFTFTGWKNCPQQVSNTPTVRINIGMDGPVANGFGQETGSKDWSMNLRDYSAIARDGEQGWVGNCFTDHYRESCIRNDALHEMGHVLGMYHENRAFQRGRQDGMASCAGGGDGIVPPDATSSNTVSTDYDPQGIMNYCKNRYDMQNAIISVLSEKDVEFLKAYYDKDGYVTNRNGWPICNDRNKVWDGDKCIPKEDSYITMNGMYICNDPNKEWNGEKCVLAEGTEGTEAAEVPAVTEVAGDDPCACAGDEYTGTMDPFRNWDRKWGQCKRHYNEMDKNPFCYVRYEFAQACLQKIEQRLHVGQASELFSGAVWVECQP